MANQSPHVDIQYIDGAPFVTARTLAKLLGYANPVFMLTLGGICQSMSGHNPVPTQTGRHRSRVDMLIPVYGALELVRHSKTVNKDAVRAWLEQIMRGETE